LLGRPPGRSIGLDPERNDRASEASLRGDNQPLHMLLDELVTAP